LVSFDHVRNPLHKVAANFDTAKAAVQGVYHAIAGNGPLAPLMSQTGPGPANAERMPTGGWWGGNGVGLVGGSIGDVPEGCGPCHAGN
jgi:hypothetical protein